MCGYDENCEEIQEMSNPVEFDLNMSMISESSHRQIVVEDSPED